MAASTYPRSTTDRQGTLQQAHSLLNEADRDIAYCKAQIGCRSQAELDRACQILTERLAAIESSLPSDGNALSQFHDIRAALTCLEICVSIDAHAKVENAEKWERLGGKLWADQRRTCVQQLKELRPKARKFNVSRFVQRIKTIKAPDSKPVFSGVFATSNESGQKIIHDLLTKMEKTPNGVHLGVSGLQNWDHIAQMRSSFAILVDHNPKVVEFNRNLLEILAKAESPQDFMAKAFEKMKGDLAKDPNHYADNIPNRQLAGEKWKKFFGSEPYVFNLCMTKLQVLQVGLKRILFLKNGPLSEKNFSFMQKMAREGKIMPLHADLCDKQTMQAIADAVHEQGFDFSSLYLSNVYDYARKEPATRDAFQYTLDALMNDKTCVIDASFVGIEENALFAPQGICFINSFIHYGKDPETGNRFDPDVARGLSKVALSSYYKQPMPLSDSNISQDPD